MARRARKRKYGSGSIYKNTPTSKTFSIKWRDQNRDIALMHGFQTREIAGDVLAQKILEIQQGRGGLAKHVDQIPSLSVLFKPWIASRQNTHEDWRHDKNRWYKHLENAVGSMKPDQVTPETVTNLINTKFAEDLSPATVCSIVRLLSTFYSDLVEGPNASSNPVADLPKKVKRLLKSNHDPETVPFLRSMADITRVYKTLEEPYSVGFAIGVYSGLRTGEILGLDWSSIDIPNRKIRVSQQITENQIKPFPKDGDSRITLIPHSLVPVLEDWKAKTGGVGLLFQPAIQLRALNKALRVALEKLELEPMTFYQASRHSFASNWVLNGGDLAVLQKLMGHTSITTTQRYAHLKIDTFSDADLNRMQASELPASSTATSSPTETRPAPN